MKLFSDTKSVAGLATLLVLCAGFSCTTPETNSDSGYDGGSSNVDRPAGYGNIPNSARRVADGYGQLRYRADRDTTVWVANDSRGFVVVSQHVRRGDEIEVVPDRNRVEIDGRTVYDRDMESGARHAIFLGDSNSWDNWNEQEPYGEIPRRARSMATGTGRIQWRADSTGRIWVGNDRDKRVVIAEDVRSGDLIEVIPNQNEVKRNGRVIYSQNMESKRQHSIFFADPGSMGGR
jgi:hypothetical protein